MSITIKKLTIQLQLQELFQSALVTKLQFCSNKVNKVVPVCLDRLTSHFAWISRLQLIENSIKESHFVPKWSICGISIKILHTRDRQINCKKHRCSTANWVPFMVILIKFNFWTCSSINDHGVREYTEYTIFDLFVYTPNAFCAVSLPTIITIGQSCLTQST